MIEQLELNWNRFGHPSFDWDSEWESIIQDKNPRVNYAIINQRILIPSFVMTKTLRQVKCCVNTYLTLT